MLLRIAAVGQDRYNDVVLAGAISFRVCQIIVHSGQAGSNLPPYDSS